LVEDDPADAEVIQHMLRRAPDPRISLRHLPTLSQAAAALEASPSFDVILLDLSLLDATVTEAMQFIRDVGAGIPIVVLTGNDDARMAMEAARHGAQDYLVKWEFNPKLLHRTLHYAMERQHAERQLRAALELAEAANRAKNDFLAMMTHEIRTPLNAVLGMTEALALTELASDQRKYVETLNRAGRHLMHLVSDVLDLSRIESGRLEIEPRRVDVRRVVADPMGFMHYYCAGKPIRLSHEVNADVPEVVVTDPDRLRQVLVNMMGNAIKFTERGSVQLRVALHSTSVDGCKLLFSVRDTGVGIAKADLPAIFESFAQADVSTTRRYGGSGLGLTISKRLIELMGGEVWVDSTPGKGSTFFFTINAALPPTTDDALEDAPESGGRHTEPGQRRSLRVLLVDDAEDNRLVIEVFLKHRGHALDMVSSGALAIERFRTERYDLILLDLHMPEMDGYAVAREIRLLEAQRGESPIPLLFLTADGLAETRIRTAAAGGTGFIAKPVDRDHLLDAIERAAAAAARGKQTPLTPPVLDSGSRDAEVERLLPRYLTARRADVHALRVAIADGALETMRRLGHNMKGNGGSYGLPAISEIGEALEMAAERGDLAAAAEQVSRLEQFLDEHPHRQHNPDPP
jgi:signal transduction histidine kinase/HPt (histidine-containing phosphotransfer) domain-containing protein